ncbi:transmembrane protein [Cystoisospora suis]|uniref:Transmembrane protein n=1 Tax=Cystoisospora suis TaxID=483139 RepID=A0A2C6KX99_9APIC|nr:transmembrane protein [Cystoisospora suis]
MASPLLCPPQEGSTHPAHLVHISPHGHWRRVPEEDKCNCTGQMAGECLSCLCPKKSSDSLDGTPATPPCEEEERKEENRDIAHDGDGGPSSSASKGTEEKRKEEEDRVLADHQTSHDEPEEEEDETNTPSRRWYICSWTGGGSSSSSAVPASQRGEEALEDKGHVSEEKKKKNTTDEEKKEVSSSSQKIVIQRYGQAPYMTREKAEAEGYKIIWYDPEEDYNPLYYGTSPEDIARSEERRLDPVYRQYSETGWRQHFTSTALLEYAGIGLGAVVGAGAVGVGFLAAAAGIAVGCTVQELCPYYKRLQRNLTHDLRSSGWM